MAASPTTISIEASTAEQDLATAPVPEQMQNASGNNLAAKQAQAQGSGLERVRIEKASDGSRVFKRNGKEALLIGGNYVLKAQPYFPPIDVIRADAKRLSEEVKGALYQPDPAQDSTEKELVCLIRLGCMMEGAMPEPGGKMDQHFLEAMEAAIVAFAENDVYVVLEIHMDAFCASNGGTGVPWWLANEMQKSQSCCKASAQCWGGCFCCCGATNASYITTPEHPLTLSLPSPIDGWVGLEAVKTVDGDTNPWEKYSVGSNTGNPGHMNVGNLNMRLNNNDSAWHKGILLFTRQVHNFGTRLYASPYDKEDCETIFKPYMSHVEMLCRAWERHSNVVAVELLNEPPLTGLPNVFEMLRSRRRLWDFHAATLEALDRCEPPIHAPIAVEDGYGSIGGASDLTSYLTIIPISGTATKKMQEWGERNRLIFSFHYYPSSSGATDMEFEPFMEKARTLSKDLMSNSPIWLSEFWHGTPQEDGQKIVESLELGANAVTFWHYVNKEWTGSRGWYKYPEEVTQYGEPVLPDATVNMDAWKAYEPTVQNGTFWGACMTGGAGGQQAGFFEDPLKHLPEKIEKGNPLAMDAHPKSAARPRLACCCFR